MCSVWGFLKLRGGVVPAVAVDDVPAAEGGGDVGDASGFGGDYYLVGGFPYGCGGGSGSRVVLGFTQGLVHSHHLPVRWGRSLGVQVPAQGRNPTPQQSSHGRSGQIRKRT